MPEGEESFADGNGLLGAGEHGVDVLGKRSGLESLVNDSLPLPLRLQEPLSICAIPVLKSMRPTALGRLPNILPLDVETWWL